MDDNDERVASATHDAERAELMSRIWWAQVPIVTIVYALVSTQPLIEKAILIYLADVSIIANAVSYAGKAKAGRAEAAGYQNP